MKKTVLLSASIVFLILCNVALSLRAKAVTILEQKRGIESEITGMESELKEKTQLAQKVPKGLAVSFSKVIDEMNLMSTYSGFNMAFVFPITSAQHNIESFYANTEFRGVKGLLLDIKVLKVGVVADVGSVLDAVYLLERKTDFKAMEISQDSQEIRVKGMLYGI